MKQLIEINLFKNVSITYKDKTVVLTKTLGKKLVNLFEYFVLNNGKVSSNSDIQSALWPESADAKDVIKYAVFRFRKSIDEFEGFEGLDLIETIDDGYALSDKYEYNVDVEIFDTLCRKINSSSILTEDDYLKALKITDLYCGELYLSNNSPLYLSIKAKEFSTQYINAISKVCEFLLNNNLYEQLVELSKKAIDKEPFEERLHFFYIKGLIGLNEHHKAIKYYDEIQEKFVSKLGIGLSSDFNKISLGLINRDNTAETFMDINEVDDDIVKNAKTKGGFYCSYSMFKYLYEIIVNTAKRDKAQCFLVLLSISRSKQKDENIKAYNKLKEVLEESIREVDIFARINNYQVIVLFRSKDMDSVYKIIDRISPRFYKRCDSKECRLFYNVKRVV